MEEARAVGKLVSEGWKPKRTMIYAAWDGEEPGLIGSTEWVETHSAELQEHVVAYVNSDVNGRGFFGASGSHTLEKFINEVSRDVIDPQTHVTVEERARAERVTSSSGEERSEARDRPDLRIAALGSGSDYTPFLQHLGIASFDLRYGGENGGGSYHSIYDSYTHYTRFKDPGFYYGIALAQTAGRTVLRLADADVLPFEFTNFSETIEKYFKEVTKLLDETRTSTEDQNRLIKERMLELAADPTETYRVPKEKDAVPYLNFSPLQNSLALLKDRANEYDRLTKRLRNEEHQSLPVAVNDLNIVLMKTERALTRSQGLPRRPWFVHQIYAPGFYTGYGVKTLPGVREAIEQRYWKEANDQIEILAQVIDHFTSDVAKASDFLRKSVESSLKSTN
jgi:N-acetylated-alpha-linked acidic dipeptidase